MVTAIVLLCGGLVLLWKGADCLVDGAVGIAERFGISQLVVGLTVVAMGTSAPEAAASVAAVISGKGNIAIGNVYGSNIANLALVGGIVALINPLQIPARTLKREVPTMLIVVLLLWPLLRDLTLSRPEAAILLCVFVALIAYTVHAAKATTVQNAPETSHSTEPPAQNLKRNALFVFIGLVGLTVGAHITITGAVTIGEYFHLSDAVIGSTIMAVGTSLPELVTCVVAATKGHHDISVGNLVGSNIFNTLLVTGAAGLVLPFSVDARFAGGVDYWIVIGVSLGFAAAALLGKRVIGRLSGTLLLAVYVGYLAYQLAFTQGG